MRICGRCTASSFAIDTVQIKTSERGRLRRKDEVVRAFAVAVQTSDLEKPFVLVKLKTLMSLRGDTDVARRQVDKFRSCSGFGLGRLLLVPVKSC